MSDIGLEIDDILRIWETKQFSINGETNGRGQRVNTLQVAVCLP